MRHGEAVASFERALADYCGAAHCIAAANGTVTLQAALAAIGVCAGDRVATTPLTMAATTIAILNVGAVPVYVDVDPDTWLMRDDVRADGGAVAYMPVSLYGLSAPIHQGLCYIDDAAQTLRRHSGCGFTSLSFQRSKILNTGEGGALLTNNADLAERARSYLSLGYRMNGKARIDSDALKSPTFDRHHMYPSINGRMNDLTAAQGLAWLRDPVRLGEHTFGNIADWAKTERREAASFYRGAIAGCGWLVPQHVPDGWQHDYWTFAVACDTPQRALDLSAAVVKHGGEKPYPAWKLSYTEPAFSFLCRYEHQRCSVAESLQPRLLQFATNDLASAERNAKALRRAIEDLS